MSEGTLFKAKRIDNGEWVEGYYIHDDIADKAYIFPKNNSANESDKIGEEGCLCLFTLEVDLSTICKCTGKEYMDSDIAYEGDIYENPYCGILFVLKYGTYEAYCPADNCYMDNVGFYAEAAGYPQMPIGDLKDYALKKGNIFDNPELLWKESTDESSNAGKMEEKVINNFCLERRTDGEINR